jgi:hypothetical protein
LQFLCIIFCFESISVVKKTLQQLKSFLETLSPHTFALKDPTQESLPPQTSLTQQRKELFVLFCFGKVMMAIDDGISSQTIAPHIIQNPIPSKTKRDPKDGERATQCRRFLRERKRKTTKKT